jgi:hypothetical protein
LKKENMSFLVRAYCAIEIVTKEFQGLCGPGNTPLILVAMPLMHPAFQLRIPAAQEGQWKHL